MPSFIKFQSVRLGSDRRLTRGVSPPERSVGHTAVDTLAPVLGLARLILDAGGLGECVGQTLGEVGGHQGGGGGGRGAGVGRGGRGGGRVPTAGPGGGAGDGAGPGVGVVVVAVLGELGAVELSLLDRG